MAKQPSYAALIEKKIISDLSGGLNDTNVATLIKDNEAQTASNVFTNLRGGVEKRYGYVKFTNDPLTFTGLSFSNSQKNTSIFNYSGNIMVAVQNLAIIQYNGVADSAPSYPVYINGTAVFTNGSATVTLATGTSEWTSQVQNLDYILDVGGQGTWKAISSVTNNTTLILQSNYTGTTGTYTYQIRQTTPGGAGSLPNAQFNGYVFYAGDGPSLNTIIGYNGTSTRRYNSIQAAGRMVSHQNYLFISNGSRLRWSTLLDGTTWTSSSFLDVAPNDGTIIQSMISWNGVLYIFKTNDIYILTGNVFDVANPTYQLIKLPNPNYVGAWGPTSVMPFQGSLIFVSYDGIYSLDGSGNIRDISTPKIRTSARSILNFNSSPAAPIAMNVLDNKLWVSFKTVAGSNTSNDMTMVLEPNGAWTKHTIAMQQGIVIAGYPSAMYYIDSATWGLFKIDGTATNDAGTAITSTWTSKIFNFGDFSKTTRVFDVYVAYYNAVNQAATLSVYDDSGQVGSSAAWTFPGGTTQFMTVQRFEVNRDTNTLYLSVTDNTVSKNFRIIGIIITHEKDSMGSGVIVTS